MLWLCDRHRTEDRAFESRHGSPKIELLLFSTKLPKVSIRPTGENSPNLRPILNFAPRGKL
jgi:hypothetical protein